MIEENQENLKIGKPLKMKIMGATLFISGLILLVYSILYSSGNMGFWSIYIGLTLAVAGLGFLGVNIGGYPF